MDREQIKQRAQQYIELETDEAFRNGVRDLLGAEDWDELSDRFYTDLEFGTGGLRGVIGGGYNRMNPFMIGRATQGLAQYVLRAGTPGPDGRYSAVIAHDSRRYSDTFALQAALVLAGNGIKAYLFPSLRPTPELSFALRKLGASAGIVVTASHNPPEYNGYKVYWNDGSQVVAPHDTAIIEEVQSVTTDIRASEKKEALSADLLEYLGSDMDDAYIEATKSVSVRPELLQQQGGSVKVVYTPLHGTGAPLVERVLGELGVNVVTVPEQREPDGEFPTVEFPNPEEASAMEMAVNLGRKEKADIVMGTDPDADRLGIAVPGAKDYELVTGNQLGVLLVDYMFSGLWEIGALPEKPAFVTTIVTTDLQRKVAAHYGATTYITLTGFKHIAGVMRELEQDPGGPTYVMGDEESYGYLIGTHVRDKDAISAVLMTTEMALYHVSQGKSVLDRLDEIYEQYGYFEEIQISKYFRGQSGKQVMADLMKELRGDPPTEIGGIDVERIRDVQNGTLYDLRRGEYVEDISLPSSNVLQFFLSDESVVSARPSGTEPKIKFYASCTAEARGRLEAAKHEVARKLQAIEGDLNAIIARAEST
ncbi:MAG: phospho-sugar mutase [Spirochaetota bacterium]